VRGQGGIVVVVPGRFGPPVRRRASPIWEAGWGTKQKRRSLARKSVQAACDESYQPHGLGRNHPFAVCASEGGARRRMPGGADLPD